MSFNWRSGNIASRVIERSGTIYDLVTTQNVDFALDDNIEVMDSLMQQRLGYFYAPRRIRITLGVLPSKYNTDGSITVTDSGKLFELQSKLIVDNPDDSFAYLDGIFDYVIDDDHQNGAYTFKDCIVMQGGPSNVIMDRRPQSQWTLLALDAEYSPKSGTTVVSYLKDGAIDLVSDTAVGS